MIWLDARPPFSYISWSFTSNWTCRPWSRLCFFIHSLCIFERGRASYSFNWNYFCKLDSLFLKKKPRLTKKLSWQWAHTTLHIPGTLGTGACGGPDGAKLITLRQFCLGHAILTDVFLHISRQLQGQRTYFRPGGAFRIGVASPHDMHLTTCCSLFPEISTRAWKIWKRKIQILPISFKNI